MNVCATKVPVDNTAAIRLATHDQVSARNKHIDIKVHHVRGLLNSDQLTLQYIPSGLQLADLFTKSVGQKIMDHHLTEMHCGVEEPQM